MPGLFDGEHSFVIRSLEEDRVRFVQREAFRGLLVALFARSLDNSTLRGFEEMNRQMFFGQYKRVKSYFEGMELASSGLPDGAELAILETVRDKVPPEVFTTAYTNPVNDSPDAMRANLREATRLLREAGYEVRDRRLVDVKTGQPFTAEVLIDQPEWERLVLPYKQPL